MNEVLHRATNEIFGRARAEDLACGGIGQPNDLAAVYKQSFRRQLEQLTVAFFAPPKCLLGALAFRNVDVDAEDCRLTLPPDTGATRFDHDLRSVEGKPPLFARRLPAARHQKAAAV